ncbi:hypothetical protein Tco_1496813, partial [Tanacetum coccineum]
IGYQENDKNKDKADKTEHRIEKNARKRVQGCLRILLGQFVSHLTGQASPNYQKPKKPTSKSDIDYGSDVGVTSGSCAMKLNHGVACDFPLMALGK